MQDLNWQKGGILSDPESHADIKRILKFQKPMWNVNSFSKKLQENHKYDHLWNIYLVLPTYLNTRHISNSLFNISTWITVLDLTCPNRILSQHSWHPSGFPQAQWIVVTFNSSQPKNFVIFPFSSFYMVSASPFGLVFEYVLNLHLRTV